MANSPTIASLLAVPTLTRDGRAQLSVGVQLSDGQRYWADCVDVPAASRLEEAAVFDPKQAANHVQQLVQPLWQGQPVTHFRPLAQQLTNLTESFTYHRPIQPKAQPATGTVSRRSLITGFLAEDKKPAEPTYEQATVERPLHPALQYGLTAALLCAVAAVNGRTVAGQVAQEYELASPDTAVPLHIALNDENIQTAYPILTSHVAALGYTTSKNNHKANLGSNGERLQQHVRQVAAWLPTLNEAFKPMLYLNLQGGLGELFANNAGRVLGALSGLEQAAKPFGLFIQNPIWRESREAQATHLEQLRSFTAVRKMSLKLVADAWVDTLAAAQLFADPKVCHMVHIELPRLGNLDSGITAVLHTKAQNQPLILSGEDNSLTTHIALATRPNLLCGSPQLHYNEMQRYLTK